MHHHSSAVGRDPALPMTGGDTPGGIVPGIILDAMRARVALLDPAGVVMHLNQSWGRTRALHTLHGDGLQVGANYLDLCEQAASQGSAEARAAADGIRSVLQGRVQEFSYDYSCHAPTGRRRFQFTVTPLSGAHRSGTVVMHIDIADSAADPTLPALDDNFRMLADNITDAFWIRSPDMREVHYVSPGFERIWGRPIDTLYTQPQVWGDFVLPEDRDEVRRVFATLTRDAPSISIEYRIVRPDGEVRWVRARGFQVRNAGGQVIHLTGIVTDITERKVADEILRARTEEFQTLAEVVPQIVWSALADGTNAYLNQRWGDYTGLTAEESMGHAWLDAFHPDDRRRMWDVWQRATDIYTVECRLRRADGEYRWWLVRGVPQRNLNDGVPRWVGTCTDIHDLKMAELEVLRSNRALQTEVADRRRAELAADAANRMKSEFLANMSHEIRTPLNGVVGMTQLALGTSLTAEQREYLDIVKSSGDALLTVINDILDFSKVEAGQLAIDVIPFDLRDCLTTTLKLLAARAHAKGLELACDIGPLVPTALLGDPGRLRQIVTNLVGNAIKFTDQGEVVLSVAIDKPSDGGAFLRFSVSDTGIGVALERHEAIFKPFVQADGSTTRRYGGTGLGLSISSDLARLMGGRLWLDSSSGRGSTFHFTISFGLQEAVPMSEAARVQLAHLQDMPVLVVDDNAVNRRILDNTVRAWGMQPEMADSGAAAIAALERRKDTGTAFSLVLLDDQMPEMDGFAVVAAIKRDPDLADVALIMLTSSGQQGDGARCRALGIAGYLMKPVSEVELRDAVLSIVASTSAGAEPRAVVTRHSLREHRGRRRILLAEDNRVNQLVAGRMLEKRGHTVVVAGNGREALALLNESGFDAFDLVLMDVQMPEMDGFEATKLIRASEDPAGRRLPIVAMTAHTMKGDEERCLAAGMDAYISKPVQFDRLFAIIDELPRSASPID